MRAPVKTRRTFLNVTLAAMTSILMPGRLVASETLAPTPELTRGPFYPPAPTGLPLLRSRAFVPQPLTNDLTKTTAQRRAQGRQIYVSGTVTDTVGRPLIGARVEIWSVNAKNIYLVEDGGASDPGFAGFGMTVTNDEGRYTFRTIRPEGYDRYLGLIRRTAHIHFLVQVNGARTFSTEMWFADEPRNRIDSFFKRVTNRRIRARMAVELRPVDGIDHAQFDIVLAPEFAGRAV
ncbi:MAG: hypothetical protein ACOVQH_10190 [Burkholderiaceae bacterium]